MTGLVSYTKLNVPAPVVIALQAEPRLTWLRLLTDLGVIVGSASTVLVMLMGQTRVAFSMARDGLLPDAIWGRAPAIRDATCRDDHRRHHRVRPCGALPGRSPRSTRPHRYAAGVRDRQCRRVGAPRAQPELAAPIPDAVRPGCSNPGDRVLLRAHAHAAAGHLGSGLPCGHESGWWCTSATAASIRAPRPLKRWLRPSPPTSARSGG